LDLLSSRSLDGLVVHASERDPILPLLGELRMPAVAVVDVVPRLPSVVVDDYAGGTFLAQHLAMLGHRHVLVKSCGGSAASAVARVDAFVSAAEKLGMRCTDSPSPMDGAHQFIDDDVRTVTEGPDRATAVMGWNDFIAATCCEKLDSLGVHIPETVAVVGFDGFSTPLSSRYRLTSIRANWANVGREAARTLALLIQGEEVPARKTLPIDFLRGNTT
jgi:LacI family transcriptional regulator